LHPETTKEDKQMAKVWKITKTPEREQLASQARALITDDLTPTTSVSVFIHALRFTVRYYLWVKSNHPDFTQRIDEESTP